MSDEFKGDSTPEETKSPDLNNIKAEMDRKLTNTESQLAELKSTNDQLLKQLESIASIQQEAASKSQQSQEIRETEDLGQLMYDNPQKYAEIIQRRAETSVMNQVRASQQAQQKQATVLSQLMSDYPELSDPNHDLTKKAVEIYGTMSQEEQSNPLAYKVAARDAATELDIKPRSKRSSQDNDSFTLSSGSSTRERRRDESSEGDIFKVAQAFGMNTDDEKIKERLLKRAKRKNWTRYQ